ncbi:hypothetical protein [Flavobacterium terrigena]|uniref:Uncharacterized protein n=1 Tax=Flavobacterium terrigena TaxID=402734 RepID=A0A1H6XQR6_9FLAO|nr:hypothetical protein [Flavobacterium terrigena]SEJ30526.1 hypothetical protein SAMN05660918_2917 [Flavobacterium terrigena]
MNEDFNIISWIFLSIAMGSQLEPITFEGISLIPDGINHSVPNQKEINSSISYLLKNDLVIKNEKKYSLSENGKEIYLKSSNENKTILKIWENIETTLLLLNK